MWVVVLKRKNHNGISAGSFPPTYCIKTVTSTTSTAVYSSVTLEYTEDGNFPATGDKLVVAQRLH